MIITDNKNSLRYVFDIDKKSFTQQTHDAVLNAWDARIEEKISTYERLYIPIKWIDGPDSAVIRSGGKKVKTDGYFLSITPEDNAIELDKIGFVNLSGNISLLDGEIFNEKLINGPIGLFKIDTFEERLSGKEFYPDKIFFNGKEKNIDDLKEIINKEYLPQLGNIITKKDRELFGSAKHKFDLCPITRSITNKYFKWLNPTTLFM